VVLVCSRQLTPYPLFISDDYGPTTPQSHSGATTLAQAMHAGFKGINKQVAELKKVVLLLVSAVSVNSLVSGPLASSRNDIIVNAEPDYLDAAICVDIIGMIKDKGRHRVRGLLLFFRSITHFCFCQAGVITAIHACMHSKSMYYKEIVTELGPAMYNALVNSSTFTVGTLCFEGFLALTKDTTSFSPSLESIVKVTVRRRRANVASNCRDAWEHCAIKLWHEGEMWSDCPQLAGYFLSRFLLFCYFLLFFTFFTNTQMPMARHRHGRTTTGPTMTRFHQRTWACGLASPSSFMSVQPKQVPSRDKCMMHTQAVWL
jgi:hypothetical protein